MDSILDLVTDNDSPEGRAVTSAIIVLAAAAVSLIAGRLVARRSGDIFLSYYGRKIAHYVVAAITAIVLAILWRPFAGNIGVVLGLVAAGLAFAMQEVIGAFAGWVNVLSGRIYRIGDRIEIGGVRGDVIDITPLRTKVMEIGDGTDERESWVRGRQFTGRVVAVSNKKTFTDPVFNFSQGFDYLWDELTLPVAYDGDWRRASEILRQEVAQVSDTDGVVGAADELMRRFPVRRADIEPRVFARATDNYVELSARFAVPLREARQMKDVLTRSVIDRFEAEGIDVASVTQEVTLTDRVASGHADARELRSE
jgi:small-conductance mechanosensitive channel